MILTKNITLTIIAIGIFGAAGYVLYAGLFKKELAVVSTPTPNYEANQQGIGNLMPYGERLDFTEVEERKENTVPFQYEQLNPADVGVPTDTMIKGLSGNDKPGPQDLSAQFGSDQQLLLKRSK